MSSIIIENLINQQLNKNKANFNFSKSIKENLNLNYNYDNKLPININTDSRAWDCVNLDGVEQLMKSYDFKTHNHMMYFLNEFMSQMNKYNKNINVIIKNNQITISLYTQDINEVTEEDINISKYLDEINDDIMFIKGL